MTSTNLESEFTHLCLPQKLPASEEKNLTEIEESLTKRVIAAIDDLENWTRATNSPICNWANLRQSISCSRNAHRDGKVEKKLLLEQFPMMNENTFLILHIIEQNAGLLIYHSSSSENGREVVFESFEASALSEHVLSAQNGLTWHFPGKCVAVSFEKFAHHSFQETLASFLEKASEESIRRFSPVAHKAGTILAEIRNTSDPALVTQVLSTLMEAIGRQVSCPSLTKRVHDDAVWSKGGSVKPWRRSAWWLVLRVGIQKHLMNSYEPEHGRQIYKFIIANVLRGLLDDSATVLHPESTHLIISKLARRLAKLETDRKSFSSDMKSLSDILFNASETIFESSIDKANSAITFVWHQIRKRSLRPLPQLSVQGEESDFRLTLRNSSAYIHGLSNPLRTQSIEARSKDQLRAGSLLASDLLTRQRKVADVEEQLEAFLKSIDTHIHSSEDVIFIAQELESYIDMTSNLYSYNPEQCGQVLLLTFELWIALDKAQLTQLPMLDEFAPPFSPQMLDVLQLLTMDQMRRLRLVQTYLKNRIEKSLSTMTIFSDPAPGCFAERYYESFLTLSLSSSSLPSLQALHQSIESATEFEKTNKEIEWQTKHDQDKDLMEKIASLDCYRQISFSSVSDEEHFRRCTRCYHKRQRRRIKIFPYEDPLPHKELRPAQLKAVLFELLLPGTFAKYRDTTWKLRSYWATGQGVKKTSPRLRLREYSPLKFHIKSPGTSITLASKSKPFMDTHYGEQKSFPVELRSLFLNHGCEYHYFDNHTGAFLHDFSSSAEINHHFSLLVPEISPYAFVADRTEFTAGNSGFNSNEVIANQPKCPPGLSPHEWLAFLALTSGYACRWPKILIELGSSNLNFGSRAIVNLLTRLVLEAGPTQDGYVSLDLVHHIFHDESFCNRLVACIEDQIYNISSNWREATAMSLVVTFALRLFTLAPNSKTRSLASTCLQRIRKTCLDWTRSLRREKICAADEQYYANFSTYCLRAALLVRKTYAVSLELEDYFDAEDVACLVEASFSFQENLPSAQSEIPQYLRNDLVSDHKMMHRLRSRITEACVKHTANVLSAIESTWSNMLSSREVVHFETDTTFDPGWIHIQLQGIDAFLNQEIDYHVLEGHLLINGQPIGALPTDLRQSILIQELYPQKALTAIPSNIPGLKLQIWPPIGPQRVYVGSRKGRMVVRALNIGNGEWLELIPRDIFLGQDQSSPDLPLSLIDNCIHWWRIDSSVIEIRDKVEPFKKKWSHWSLNFATRHANRRESYLMDPRCSLFAKLTGFFQDFEVAHHIVVSRTRKRRILMELKRLKLSFQVFGSSKLECNELQAVVDTNQDAGTLYGLAGKIVLKDINNPSQRSVLLPLGEPSCKRLGPHVQVKIQPASMYGRYFINTTLGRLECPTEPRLLYNLAMFHAHTSFVLADPLTGRTGTEEALALLKSGKCQPWAPLSNQIRDILRPIAALSPRTVYYPEHKIEMQEVFWNEQLTQTIQHGELRSTVQNILQVSDRLSTFDVESNQRAERAVYSKPCLEERLLHRRVRYLRDYANSSEETDSSLEYTYPSRDREISSQTRCDIFDMVSIIEQEPSRLSTNSNICKSLEAWPITAGYQQRFVLLNLQDALTNDLGALWGHLVEFCTHVAVGDKFQMMVIFSLLAFSNPKHTDILRAIVAFRLFPELQNLEKPPWPSFMDYKYGQKPNKAKITELISAGKVFFPRSPGQLQIGAGGRRSTSMGSNSLTLAEDEWDRKCQSDLTDLVDTLISQWPTENLQTSESAKSSTIDVPKALELVSPLWQLLYRNYTHSCYLEQVQEILDSHSTSDAFAFPSELLSDQKHYPYITYRYVVPSLARAFEKADFGISSCVNDNSTEDRNIPDLESDRLRNAKQLLHNTPDRTRKAPSQTSFTQPETRKRPRLINSQQPLIPQPASHSEKLLSTLETFDATKSSVRKHYAKSILDSLHALQTLQNETTECDAEFTTFDTATRIEDSKRAVERSLQRLEEGLKCGNSGAKWLRKGHLWPVTSPITILTKLSRSWNSNCSIDLKDSVIQYGIDLTELQRNVRVEDSYRRQLRQRFVEDVAWDGCRAWSPHEYPEWLLIEVESNILIRQEQVEVALATIFPSSDSNSVVQLQMGRGKTSCIIPMAAAILANSHLLVRVIVPRPLLLQTAQVLQSRLGGLLDRQVRHIPFSRRTPHSDPVVEEYTALHQEILNNSGVVLALPEHIMSFQLSGLQQFVDGHTSQARKMVRKQEWFSSVCRDIMDESDQILSVKTQLIFPNGAQMAVDGHPWRWKIAENLLQLIRGHLAGLKNRFPQSVEIFRISADRFPIVQFLRKDAEEAMSTLLVRDVIRGCVRGLPTDMCSDAQLSLIRQFVTSEDVPKSLQKSVRALFPDNPAALDALYLTRGLLSQKIILVCLKKRYNVQYGLHPERTPLAVPFLAKGIPSQTAEWGHVDVSIILTILSFYYGGLTELQLREGFQKILQSDDSAGRYEKWVQSAPNLPESLRHWNSVNVDDHVQLRELWCAFKYSTVVIDDYLNALVFPKHARQFATKIQNSGWDLLLDPLNRSVDGTQDSVPKDCIRSTLRSCVTTGFSGTNDNRHVLPLNVVQCDLNNLAHTNAEVMNYLFEERNQGYILAANNSGKHISEKELLCRLHASGISILIDAGAQIFELTNHDLAKTWLSVADTAEAAAYFDDNDRLMVLFRNSEHKTPFSISPFAENMGKCLLYLDQAHTRGVDIKLPPTARAALTLSLGQTKDDTVQAAMRLRQLATTQSIVWVAPPEVDQSIRDLRQKKMAASIDSQDVIAWLIEQTCLGLEAMQPLFYSQGMDFCRRSQAFKDNPRFLTEEAHLARLLGVLKQNERQTLREAYGGSESGVILGNSELVAPSLPQYCQELGKRRADILSSGIKLNVSAFSEVEQEREVEQEVESVREVQKPFRIRPKPVPTELSNDLNFFLSEGQLPESPQSTRLAFSLMANTGVGQKFAMNHAAASGNLFASEAFGSTVSTKDSADNYLRPVNWILMGRESDVAVLVSPEEAEMILAIMHKDNTRAYLLTYMAPFTRAMLRFNHLDYLSLPALPKGWKAPTWLVTELGIFAGAIYFGYDDCRRVAEFLGIASIDDAQHFEEDKTEPSRSKAREYLVSKPLSFLQAWLDIRRKSSDFSHTPMGFLAQGRALPASHSFFKVDARRVEEGEAGDDESENSDGEAEVPSVGNDAEEDLGSDNERDETPVE